MTGLKVIEGTPTAIADYLDEIEKELTKKWQEIITTANDGDPKYSFELFKELMSEKKSKEKGQ